MNNKDKEIIIKSIPELLSNLLNIIKRKENK